MEAPRGGAIRCRGVARVLIVGGGCRGRLLAAEMIEQGHATRVTTRTEAGRAAIEATGAECVIGTPDRLGTLRGALENVTIVCWLLASAKGSPEEVLALHGSRLASFLGQAIDTTMRGFIYESAVTVAAATELTGSAKGASGAAEVTSGAVEGPGGTAEEIAGTAAEMTGPAVELTGASFAATVPREALVEGERIVREIGEMNAIPVAFVCSDRGDTHAWLTEAEEAVEALLVGT